MTAENPDLRSTRRCISFFKDSNDCAIGVNFESQKLNLIRNSFLLKENKNKGKRFVVTTWLTARFTPACFAAETLGPVPQLFPRRWLVSLLECREQCGQLNSS